MVNLYTFHNGTQVFVSNSTMSLKIKDKSVNKFCSILPKLERCQVLIDFTLFDLEHTGHNIGCWHEDAHRVVGCLPSYIGGHMVDGTSNGRKVVQELKWNTGHEKTTQIVSSKCDAHQINTMEKRASGPSAHKINLNPELWVLLTLLHTTLNCVTNSAAQMTMYGGVQKEYKYKVSPTLATTMKTHWNSEHKEADITATNQDNLYTTLDQMIFETGIDCELFKTNE